VYGTTLTYISQYKQQVMKNITRDDQSNYELLDINDPFVCQKAHAYTLTPDPLDPKWEVISYYRDITQTGPTYIRKYVDGVGVRWDNRTENNWLEDLKNLDI
jgi:hypothetical protein